MAIIGSRRAGLRSHRAGSHRVAVRSRRPMWYIYGTCNHRMFVYGGFTMENEAMRKGNEVDDWDNEFEVVQLPTTDLTAAKSEIKAILTGKSGSLAIGTKRMFRGE